MHRTRTTAKVLVGVAVAAVSGCVSVEAGPASGALPVPEVSSPAAARDVEPQIVQAPAREALEAAMPSPEATPSKPPRRTAPKAEKAPAEKTARRYRPDAPGQGWQRDLPELPPSVRLPPAAHSQVGGGDLCALGKKYGGWQPHSPQDRICEDAYGQ